MIFNVKELDCCRDSGLVQHFQLRYVAYIPDLIAMYAPYGDYFSFICSA